MSQNLHDLQVAAGATHDVSGSVAHFGNPHAEYARAKTEVALFDLTGRTHIEMTGKDRVKFLHSFSTNDIKSLAVGRGCEAFLPTIQGKVLAHLFVFAEADSLWLDSIPGCAAQIVPHLSKFRIREDVEFVDRTSELGVLFLTGPDAEDWLKRLDLPVVLSPLQHGRARNERLQVRRVDLLGVPGWELCLPAQEAAALWTQITTAGIKPAGMDVFQALRIESGMPWYGLDITTDNLAQEVARTATAISFNKGCYLGQEPIARIDALGHVNQELRSLHFASVPAPASGTQLFGVEDDKAIGRITSSVISPADDLPVALGYVRRNFNTAGSLVRWKDGEEWVSGKVRMTNDK